MVAREHLGNLLGARLGIDPQARLDYGYQAVGKLTPMAKGETIGHMANSMSLSVKTVSTYRARVLEKLGFVREGTLREDCVVNGEVSDSWVYGLIRREWRPSSGPGNPPTERSPVPWKARS